MGLTVMSWFVNAPLEEHSKLLDLIEITSREFIDVKVVPDLLQVLALASPASAKLTESRGGVAAGGGDHQLSGHG